MISGETIKCRPFLVKEEKLFFIAMESDDVDDMYTKTLQIVDNCILDEGIKVDELPFFEIDYLILSLRAQSVGNSVPMSYVCNHKVEGDKECGKRFTNNISLSDVKVHREDSKEDEYTFGDISVKLRYPNYREIKKAENDLDDFDQKVDLLSASIVKIWDKDTVYDSMTNQEKMEFIEGLTRKDFDKLQDFIDGAPWINIETKVTCPKCGFVDDVEYDGFESFFV